MGFLLDVDDVAFAVAIPAGVRARVATAGGVVLSEAEDDALFRSKLLNTVFVTLGLLLSLHVFGNGKTTITLFATMLISWAAFLPGRFASILAEEHPARKMVGLIALEVVKTLL